MNFQDLLNLTPSIEFKFNSTHIQGIMGVGILSVNFYDEKTHAQIEIEREMIFSVTAGVMKIIAENNDQNRFLRMLSVSDKPDVESLLHDTDYDNFNDDFDMVVEKIAMSYNQIKSIDVSKSHNFYFGA